MPKRNTTETAIANLNTADKANADARAEILATIPAPVFNDHIAFSLVRRDRNLNVREDKSYGYKANPALWASLKEFGLQMRNPMMSFSRQPDGTFLTISGNLRGDCMEGIRAEELARREKEGIPTTPDNPLPFETIHGLVWEGLSSDQEHCLITDQTMAKGLNEFELARAIGEFWERNPRMTDKKAGVYFGMDKNKVSRLRMRYCMPTVFEEYRKEKSKDADVSYVKVGNEQLTALYSAYLSDRDAGNRHREEGPAFKRAWGTILANPDAYKRAGSDKPEDKVKDRESIANQAAGAVAAFGDTPEINAIRLALLWAIGENGPDGNPVNLNTVQSDLKTYCDTLRSERDSASLACEAARNDLSTVRDTMEGRNATIAEKDAEINDLNAERKGIWAEHTFMQEQIIAKDAMIGDLRDQIAKKAKNGHKS